MLRTTLALLLFTAVLSAQAQTPAASSPAIPKDPEAVLAAAAPFYNYDTPPMQPWHLKATYQLYDMLGKPAEKGTWEYWYASSNNYRETWTRDGGEQSDWFTADGAVHQSESGAPLHFFERKIPDFLLHPLDGVPQHQTDSVKFELKFVPPEKPQIVCVITNQQRPTGQEPPAPPANLARSYCFDLPTSALLTTYSGNYLTQYNHILRTQDHYLPKHMEVTIGKQQHFSLDIEEVNDISATDPALIPPAGTTLSETTVDAVKTVRGKIAMGKIAKKVPPIYPEVDKLAHIQGVVTLIGTVGKDGRISNLEVLTAPSITLGEAALDAVKRWEYRPYMLNGKPVEVQTTINVIFTLGR
ncbi:MAG: energy transducer TonB [Acidobacteriota bacterium]|nr:energy transducer TonB [Acidobacteriota bacterium]